MAGPEQRMQEKAGQDTHSQTVNLDSDMLCAHMDSTWSQPDQVDSIVHSNIQLLFRKVQNCGANDLVPF